MKYWNKPFVLEIYIRVTKKLYIYYQNWIWVDFNSEKLCSIPFGVSALPNKRKEFLKWVVNIVSIPFGVSALPNKTENVGWVQIRFQSPLGFLLFQTAGKHRHTRRNIVSIPFGVSALPNCISAIPVFMRAKLVICGEESFFRNISTENPLKMPLSPVFMRCAVKFIFSFIAFIYYNGNFL